uniref:NADH-ubiquinone oxidoreductase chain 2 n=1 Tax=Pyramidella dolabrata TaxID=252582 RepID=B3DFG8_9GAST|nr:NADH dehydrogenase subunit 2 [Pyramidella dolabrata]ACE62855.1 NADH dehydrogenase subunit 2 [Pyramidella dolabrata]
MSSSSFIFTLLIGLGPILSMSSSSWFFCWVGLEISFIGFIPMLFSSENMNVNKEAAMKYFCIQALASAVLLVSGMSIYYYDAENFLMGIIFLFSLCLKLGVVPGHFWVPTVSLGTGWFGCFLMLGPMKLVPFQVLVLFCEKTPIYTPMVLVLGGLSAMAGAFLGNNQTTVRGMMGASSVAHSGWLLLASTYGSLWAYMVTYIFLLGFTLSFFMQKENLSASFCLLTLSGVPPFIMFLMKLLVLLNLSWLNGSSIIFVVLPILGTVLSLFFYLSFTYAYYLQSKAGSSGMNLPFWGVNFMSVLAVMMLI